MPELKDDADGVYVETIVHTEYRGFVVKKAVLRRRQPNIRRNDMGSLASNCSASIAKREKSTSLRIPAPYRSHRFRSVQALELRALIRGHSSIVERAVSLGRFP